jgi:fermentation-respiration switch protein FrsA (DUF1100 family)
MLVALKWLLVGLGAYIGAIGLLYFFQRSLMYFPASTRMSPALAGLPEAKELVLATSDGEQVIAWHVPAKPDKPVVIFFHGNGEILPWRVARDRELTSDGTGLIALSYRGYGGSTGSPTEAGLHRDAAAAYAFAAARYASDRVVLWGHSLGTGVAVKLASEKPVGKLILEAAYSSALDVAASVLPFVPVRLLMHDQYRSDEGIGAVAAPLLFLHGERDNVISIAFAERLFALANEPKRFVRFADGGHNDLDDHGAGEVVRAFLAEP